MDDLKYGKRNKRGDWAPDEPVGTAPLFVLPPRPLAFLKWLPHYFLPWNLLFALSAVAWWAWIVPPSRSCGRCAWGWILRLFARQLPSRVLSVLRRVRAAALRARERQGIASSTTASSRRSRRARRSGSRARTSTTSCAPSCSGVPIWTAIEVAILWAFANGYAPWLSFAEHPVYLAAWRWSCRSSTSSTSSASTG